MIENGFLLGAGASFELGMPLVDELTKAFKKGLLRNLDSNYYNCPQKLKTLARTLLSDDSLNYEEIMGRIEIELQRNRDPNLHNEWHWLLGRYNEDIFFLLLEYHQNNISYIKQRLDFLAPISKFSKDKPLWIFNLNHDLLIEMIARYLNMPIEYGLKDSIKINGFQFQKLSRENMDSNQFSFLFNKYGINLVKLHGALDLFIQGDKKEYFKLINSTSWDGIISDLARLAQDDAATKDYGGRIANEITYNDDKGILQFLRMTIMSGKHKYSTRMQHTLDDWFLRIFRGHINHVNRLYCIGYSFSDTHINDILYEWLSFSADRKIIIVDPFVSGVPANFKHIKNQFEIKKMGFLTFLNEGADAQTLLKIKLFQKAREIFRESVIKNISLKKI